MLFNKNIFLIAGCVLPFFQLGAATSPRKSSCVQTTSRIPVESLNPRSILGEERSVPNSNSFKFSKVKFLEGKMWKDLPTSFKNILGDPIFVVLPTPTDVALVVQVDANTIGVEVFRLLADHRFMRIAHFTSSDGEQLNLLKQEFSADATSSIDLTPHVNEKGALILNILQFSPQRKAKVYEFDLPK